MTEPITPSGSDSPRKRTEVGPSWAQLQIANMMMKQSGSVSDFWDKLNDLGSHPLTISRTLCAWSDLLGFGTAFRNSQWEPSTEEWQAIGERLKRAYAAHCMNIFPGAEASLMINDGIVRAYHGEYTSGYIAEWLRQIVISHLAVIGLEEEAGYPGCRTVIAAGQRANYGFESIHFGELRYNYTKSPDSASNDEIGHQLVYNPAPFQMNTAFSKAYIIDSLGSSAGVSGANLFIDQSVVELIINLARFESLPLVDKQVEEGRLLGVHSGGKRYRPGFLLDQPIKIDDRAYNTVAYRVIKFFPWDEDWDYFSYDL